MRVTSGKLKGRALITPDDARIRPTSDKVRQGIFNILTNGMGIGMNGLAVADLFAGTGALGIEALSRGARFCLFVDDDAASRALQRENIEALSLTGVSKIWRRDATDLGPMNTGSGGPFDLVFLDPPYRKGLAEKALASLRDGNWLAKSSIVVVETATDETLETAGFNKLDERDYGETRVALLAPSE
jgi:16S rRNA (guanine966-N2)-methyltransferase